MPKRLIEDICTASGIDRAQAELALYAVLHFLAARLPSPIMGQVCEVVHPPILEGEAVRGAEVLGNGQ